MKTIKQNGITLIALVITIIVLLILAGVSIATLTGENGILTRANDAKTSTEIAEEKEKVELATVAAYTDAKGGELQQNVLEQELGKYFTSGKYNVTPGTNEDGTEGYIVTITENDQNGRKYFVDKNGNVTEYTAKEPEETPEDATAVSLIADPDYEHNKENSVINIYPEIYWTRTVSNEGYKVRCVNEYGDIVDKTSDNDEIGIRPAMWIKYNAE